MQQKLERDIKAAMLAGDKTRSEVIKGLKNALQYEAVAQNSPDRILSEEQAQAVLAREAKKRQEAADLYKQGGSTERAGQELAEKQIIEEYLPEPMSGTQLAELVKAAVAAVTAPTLADMGKIIGAVKAKAGTGADGATIARLVKQALES